MKNASKISSPALCAAALFITLVVLLAGCGQRGPLYLPEDDPGARPAAADATSAEDPDETDEGSSNPESNG